MVEPCCPKCGSKEITAAVRTYVGCHGILVYCADCGAIISWAPEPVE